MFADVAQAKQAERWAKAQAEQQALEELSAEFSQLGLGQDKGDDSDLRRTGGWGGRS